MDGRVERAAFGEPRRASAVQFMIEWAYKRLAIAFGVALMVVSIPIGLVTPFLPIGLPLLLIGAAIVLNSSDTAKRAFVRWRRRYPETGRRLRTLMRRFRRSNKPPR